MIFENFSPQQGTTVSEKAGNLKFNLIKKNKVLSVIQASDKWRERFKLAPLHRELPHTRRGPSYRAKETLDTLYKRGICRTAA